MKKIFTIIAAFILMFAINRSSAQSPTGNNIQSVTSSRSSFYTIRDNFYNKHGKQELNISQDENIGEENEEESYYNEFKRWEYLMQSRTFPTGKFPDPGILFKEYDNYKLSHPDAFNTRSATWTPVGTNGVPGNGGGVGRLNVIRFDPTNSNTIYLGAAGGGVWKSTNGGTTWTDLTSGIPVTSIADIAIDPLNPLNIYIATGDESGYEATWQSDNDFWGGVYSAGVLKSTDGGNTWNPTGLSYSQNNNQIIQRLIIHPADPTILLAATRSGIYRTANGGTTWSLTLADHCYDMELNTSNPDIIYACGNLDIFKSTDAGSTWTVIKNNLCQGGRISIETSASNSQVIYALCENGSLSKSTDGGVSWVSKGSPSGAATFYGYYDLVLECSDANSDVLVAGGLYVAKSTNGGTSWQTTSVYSPYTSSSYVHADNHDLEFLPGSSQTIFSGNDGGIFKTTNQGSSWTDLSSGLQIAQIYRASSSATNPNIVYSGWQDNGSNRWNGTTYTQVYGADGMKALVDYTNSNIAFIETQYGGIQKTTNGGTSFSNVAPSSGAWLTEYIMDPVDHNKMYAGYSSLYKSTNNGSTWSNIASNLYSGDYATSIAVAPSNTSIIYTSSLGIMKKSITGGTSWTTITAGLPVASAGINYIAVSNTDPDKVWVVFSGYSAGNKVFRSINGGTSWTNISGSLPNLPVNTIVYENGSPDRVYAGTDIGVYYLDNNTADWTYYNDGLANVMIHELSINYTSDKLIAATYGRGVWQSDLVGTGSATSISTSPIGSSSLCPGQNLSVPFTIGGSFNAGNIFTSQLSDASGNFTSPTNIGTLASTSQGSVSSTIPSSAAGIAYRIRVIASNPATTGTDNGSNLTITCPQATSLSTTNVTATSAMLNWVPASCSQDYQIQYRATTSSTWSKINAIGSSQALSSLTPSTTYKWKIRTKCVNIPKVWSTFTPVKTFTTAVSRSLIEDQVKVQELNVYPNPLNNTASVEFSIVKKSHVQIDLLDVQGKVVKQLFNGNQDEGNFQITMSREELSAGVYMLQMMTDEGTMTKKVVIE